MVFTIKDKDQSITGPQKLLLCPGKKREEIAYISFTRNLQLNKPNIPYEVLREYVRMGHL